MVGETSEVKMTRRKSQRQIIPTKIQVIKDATRLTITQPRVNAIELRFTTNVQVRHRLISTQQE